MGELIYILALGVVVTVHEFGHYSLARLMGVRVKRLQIFFYSLYSFRPKASKRPLSGTSWRDTTYSIGWLPFGGYTSYESSPSAVTFTDSYGQRHTIDYTSFRQLQSMAGDELPDFYYDTKPPWKRFLISVGGVLFNLICAFLIYMTIILMSNVDSEVGIWHEVCAAADFIGYAVGGTLSNICGMVGISLGHPSLSPEHYDVIAAFVATASKNTFALRVADLSCVLALINILPIPPLDGGHALFEAYEMVTGKKPIQGFQRVASVVGSIIFIILFWILPILSR